MARPKKYTTEEERREARREACARYRARRPERKVVRATAYLSGKQAEKLEKEAEKRKVPRAEVLRELVDSL